MHEMYAMYAMYAMYTGSGRHDSDKRSGAADGRRHVTPRHVAAPRAAHLPFDPRPHFIHRRYDLLHVRHDGLWLQSRLQPPRLFHPFERAGHVARLLKRQRLGLQALNALRSAALRPS